MSDIEEGESIAASASLSMISFLLRLPCPRAIVIVIWTLVVDECLRQERIP